MRRSTLFVFALIIMIAGAGCRQAAGGIPVNTPAPGAAGQAAADVQIALGYDPVTPTVGEATLIVTLTTSAGVPVTDALVSARGDMNHAGMMPETGDGQHTAAGIYRIPFNWTMAGDWIVTVVVVLPDGSSATRRFDVTVAS